jgi:hypothetical protein
MKRTKKLIWFTFTIAAIEKAEREWVAKEKFVGSIFHSKIAQFDSLLCSIYIALYRWEEWDQFRVDNLWDFSTVKRKISNWIAINLFLRGSRKNSHRQKGSQDDAMWISFRIGLMWLPSASHKARRIYSEWEVDILKFIPTREKNFLLYRHGWSLQASIKLLYSCIYIEENFSSQLIWKMIKAINKF